LVGLVGFSVGFSQRVMNLRSGITNCADRLAPDHLESSDDSEPPREKTMQPTQTSAAATPPTDAPECSLALTDDQRATEETRHRLRLLPREVGAVLLGFGVAGLVLPGPFGTPLILAGGLVLAPRLFHRTERWFERRFPNAHRAGRRHVDRFLDDFERRYPRHRG
jgi:hypothetical protein